jgi:hypothetical protein
MTKRTIQIGAGAALIAVALAGAPFVRGRAQEAPAPLPPASLEERVRQLEEIVAEQQVRIDHLVRIADGLFTGADRLSTAAEQSRLLGFEWAGANPAARTELLNGMWSFQDALLRAVAPPEEAEPSSSR